MTQEFTVDPRAASERLDVFLARSLSVSRSNAARMITNNLVLVNDKPQRASYLTQAEDRVNVSTPAPVERKVAPIDLPIIYQDDEIVVIDKPAHVAAHPGSGTDHLATVADFARLYTTDPDPERPGIIHRLDRDTSGLMIIARTLEAKNAMQDLFRAHKIRKTYTTLVVGRLAPDEATIRLPLDRDPAHPLRRAVVAGGREAITKYKTLATYPGYSLVEAKPETGRTHQIRVHFAALGHPVAGDIVYSGVKRPLGLDRHFLHASALEFTTPAGQALSLQAALPEELNRVVKKLEGDV